MLYQLSLDENTAVGSVLVDLRDVVTSNLGGSCSHEPVCAAVHRVIDPDTPTSDYYCCRATGSLCEAIYNAYYDGMTSGDRVGDICRAIEAWCSRSMAQRVA